MLYTLTKSEIKQMNKEMVDWVKTILKDDLMGGYVFNILIQLQNLKRAIDRGEK